MAGVPQGAGQIGRIGLLPVGRERLQPVKGQARDMILVGPVDFQNTISDTRFSRRRRRGESGDIEDTLARLRVDRGGAGIAQPMVVEICFSTAKRCV